MSDVEGKTNGVSEGPEATAEVAEADTATAKDKLLIAVQRSPNGDIRFEVPGGIKNVGHALQLERELYQVAQELQYLAFSSRLKVEAMQAQQQAMQELQAQQMLDQIRRGRG